MKTILKSVGGFGLQLVAAPLIATGQIAQLTGRGLIAAGDWTASGGEKLELKGLGLAVKGEDKVIEARVTGKMTAAEKRAAKRQERDARIASLLATQEFRRQLRKNNLGAANMQDAARQATQLIDALTVPAT